MEDGRKKENAAKEAVFVIVSSMPAADSDIDASIFPPRHSKVLNAADRHRRRPIPRRLVSLALRALIASSSTGFPPHRTRIESDSPSDEPSDLIIAHLPATGNVMKLK